jgi:hypothetical protein
MTTRASPSSWRTLKTFTGNCASATISITRLRKRRTRAVAALTLLYDAVYSGVERFGHGSPSASG